ncbi:MAG: nucleotidyltransferase [Ruminococcaceae bacterium]|nr:nucleotidyltransferase [Oscillospiraceae bacterium]
MSKDITLVVLAAGMGSRFGGLKQIEPIGPGGEAILDFSVYDAIKAGFTKVVFVIKHEIEKDFKEIVGKRIEKQPIKVEYAFQELNDLPEGYTLPADRAKPWGTAHAILACREIVKEPFAVINADDYYGSSAFAKVAEFLRQDNDDYCMVGYRLENTLTENGYVSRGVCEVVDGKLSSVTERTKIANCKYTEDDGATWHDLAPDTLVSMNFWGLRADLFPLLEKSFKAFLDEKINVPKSECYIPKVISDLIETGVKKVQMLTAEDKWYGVTYKEDKEMVVNAIGKMVADGMYNGI